MYDYLSLNIPTYCYLLEKLYLSKCKTRFPIRLAAAATIDSVIPKIIFKFQLEQLHNFFFLI